MKIKHMLLTATAIAALSTNTIFASTSFSDVSTSSWYYDTVTEAADLGLFSGTGNGLFSPSQTMTRAEFVTVVMRAIAPDADYSTSGAWWQGYYDVAVDSGILLSSEFDGGDMTKDMSRQEMALVLVRAMEYTGESVAADVSTSLIADYSSIGSYYKDDVLTAYSNGLISGYTDGTFLPDGVMTRAEGATVLMRLVDSSKRVPTEEGVEEIVPVEGAVYFYEGQAATSVPKEGDIYVFADGTQVVYAYNEYGILCAEGAAGAVGLETASGQELQANARYTTWDQTEVDSFGNSLNNQTYLVNGITDTGIWSSELTELTKQSYPTSDGTYKYELSSDSNWYWSSNLGMWITCYGDMTDAGIALIKEANGL